VRRATIEGKPHADPELAHQLRALPYPRYFPDFETANFAVPIWKGTRPYEHLPFQWSCHIERRDGSLDHEDFLDASGAPPMRAFAESLLEALGTEGPIVVYSGFEKTVLKSLAPFPDLSPRLEHVIEFVRPAARAPAPLSRHEGLVSIKAVLPTVAPDSPTKGWSCSRRPGRAASVYRARPGRAGRRPRSSALRSSTNLLPAGHAGASDVDASALWRPRVNDVACLKTRCRVYRGGGAASMSRLPLSAEVV
jgi:hypothetical protein